MNKFFKDSIYLAAVSVFLIIGFYSFYMLPSQIYILLQSDFFLTILILFIMFIIYFVSMPLTPNVVRILTKNIQNHITSYGNLFSKEPAGNTNAIEKNDDSPEIKIENDELRRTDVVEKIYKLIDGRTNIVVGINAAWGEGKTTVANFIKEKLKEKADGAVCIDFNPHSYSRDESMQKAFFRELDVTLNDKILRAISRVISKTHWLIELFFTYFVEQKTLDKLKKDFIKRNKKKVYIFIDDIDRLEREDILDIFKIIGQFRGVKDGKNFYFILMFDTAIVIDTLGIESKTKYFEKFIDRIFTLATSPDLVDNFVKSRVTEIDKGLGTLVITKETEDMYKFSDIIDHTPMRFGNLREAKRFINVFKINFDIFQTHIHPADIYNMSLVDLFFPNIYKELINNEFVLTSSVNNNTVEAIEELLKNKDNKDKSKIKRLLKDIFDNPTSYDIPGKERLKDNDNLSKWFAGEKVIGLDNPEYRLSTLLNWSKLSIDKKIPATSSLLFLDELAKYCSRSIEVYDEVDKDIISAIHLNTEDIVNTMFISNIKSTSIARDQAGLFRLLVRLSKENNVSLGDYFKNPNNVLLLSTILQTDGRSPYQYYITDTYKSEWEEIVKDTRQVFVELVTEKRFAVTDYNEDLLRFISNVCSLEDTQKIYSKGMCCKFRKEIIDWIQKHVNIDKEEHNNIESFKSIKEGWEKSLVTYKKYCK